MEKTHRVLITGSDGFVGKHLVSELKKRSCEVYLFSDLRGQDVCKKEAFDDFFDKEIDIVFHLASRTFVPDSWKNPDIFYETNTFGTQNVLDFCVKTGAKLVYIGAYIYGTPKYLPIDEKHPVSPNNPYAHSKWLAEELCRFYSKEFGVKTIILRPFNIFGEGQNENFLIPFIIKQIYEKNAVEVKDANPKRDYLYISDFIDALILLMDYEKAFSIFNIGCGYSFSVKQIIEMIIECYGKEIEWFSLKQERKNEILETVADVDLIKNALNWKPVISFKEGINRMLKAAENKYARH